MRLEGKTAVVVGAGQSPGQGVGNGRATCLLFGREGARVMCVDRDLDSAEETAQLVRDEGGEAEAIRADVMQETDLANVMAHTKSTWGQLDILHNNVGISVAGGDAPVTEITVEAFDLIMAVNIRSVVLACKYAVPIMREQRSGSIINISSMAVLDRYPWVSYKVSKSGMIAFTEQLAYQTLSTACVRILFCRASWTRRWQSIPVRESGAKAVRRWLPLAMQKSRFGERWAPPGMSRMQRSTSPRTRPTS